MKEKIFKILGEAVGKCIAGLSIGLSAIGLIDAVASYIDSKHEDNEEEEEESE